MQLSPPQKNQLKSTLTTDSSLLNLVQEEDNAAWNVFYGKYSAMIHAVGQKKHLSAEECDDLMINVMTIFWKKMNDFVYDPRKGKFRNYLSKIAYNCAMQILSRKKTDNSLSAEITPDYPADIDKTIMKEWQDFLIKKALEVLREQIDTESYLVFHMSFFQDIPLSDVASITGKSLNNIYVIRSRCLKRMTAIIKELRQLDEKMLSLHSHKNELEN